MSDVVAKPDVEGADAPRKRLDSLNDLAGTVATWLLAAIFLTLPLNNLRPFREIALADILIVFLLPIAFYLFVVRLIAGRRFGSLPKWLWIGAALLVLSMLLVALLPPYDPERLVASFDAYGTEAGSSTVVGVRVIFALIVFPIVIGVVVDRWSTIRLLVNAWIIGVSISCAVAAIDVFLGLGLQKALSYDPETTGAYILYLDRQVGLSDHPNALSLMAVMVSPLIMMRMKSRAGLLRYGPVLVLICLGVLLSGARSGIVGLVLAAGLVMIMDPRFRSAIRGLRLRTGLAIGTGLVAVLLLLFAAAAAPPDSGVGKLVPSSVGRLLRSSDTTTSASDKERQTRIHDSIGYIKERPVLGYGFKWVESSHNTVLQLLLAGGVSGLVGFFLVLAGYLKAGFSLRRLVPEDQRDTCIALTISLLIYVISGLVTNHIFERYLYIPAGLLLAMLLLSKAAPVTRNEQ